MATTLEYIEYLEDGRLKRNKMPEKVYTGFDDVEGNPICNGDVLENIFETEIFGKVYYDNGFRWTADDEHLNFETSNWARIKNS